MSYTSIVRYVITEWLHDEVRASSRFRMILRNSRQTLKVSVKESDSLMIMSQLRFQQE